MFISTFWTNTIWYVLLGIITIFEIVFVIFKAERRKQTFAFYLTLLGITLNFETIILICYKAYFYYPMIIKKTSEPFHDILAGNLFSQFSVAATILLVVVFDLKSYWYIIFAAVYGIIEYFFMAIGIYSQNWYRTWMTVSILPFAFWIAKKMNKKIKQDFKPVFYYGFIFLAMFPLDVITLIWGLMLSGYTAYSTTLVQDPITSRYATCLPLTFIPTSIASMIIHFSKIRWNWKALIVIAIYILYYINYKFNLLWIKDGWFLTISTVTFVWIYLSIAILDKLYGGIRKNPSDYK